MTRMMLHMLGGLVCGLLWLSLTPKTLQWVEYLPWNYEDIPRECYFFRKTVLADHEKLEKLERRMIGKARYLMNSDAIVSFDFKGKEAVYDQFLKYYPAFVWAGRYWDLNESCSHTIRHIKDKCWGHFDSWYKPKYQDTNRLAIGLKDLGLGVGFWLTMHYPNNELDALLFQLHVLHKNTGILDRNTALCGIARDLNILQKRADDIDQGTFCDKVNTLPKWSRDSVRRLINFLRTRYYDWFINQNPRNSCNVSSRNLSMYLHDSAKNEFKKFLVSKSGSYGCKEEDARQTSDSDSTFIECSHKEVSPGWYHFTPPCRAT